jgi:hypothetical protein
MPVPGGVVGEREKRGKGKEEKRKRGKRRRRKTPMSRSLPFSLRS